MALGGFRTFGERPVGKILLIVAGILALTGALYELGPLIGILVMLVFGAFLPIYLGWRSTRQLALAGLLVLLVSAPLYSVVEAGQLRVPSPSESSNPAAPYGNGQAVLQNATVSPFAGATGGNYVFSAQLEPQNLPARSTLHFMLLYVTDCPGATGNQSPNCPSGYPFYTQNHTFPTLPTAPTTISYTQRLPGTDVWWWTLELAFNNSTSKALTYDWLFSNGAYSFIEGPVSGTFAQTTGYILPVAFEVILIYPGLVFFVGLLIYAVLKRRQQSRGAGGPSVGAPGLPPGMPPSTPPGPGAVPSTPPTSEERRCPNCQAVVYPNEASCWKCGQSLLAPKSGNAQRLSSGKGP